MCVWEESGCVWERVSERDSVVCGVCVFKESASVCVCERACV